MNFLNYDSAFMTALRKAVDYFFLGFLWLLAVLGVVTFGAATTAMLYTAEKSIRKDEGKVFVTFWKRFAKEFKQATLLGLIGMPIASFLAFNALLLWGVELPALIFALVLVASIFVLCWVSLWFGYLSYFKDPIRLVLSNTFRMVFAYLPWAALLGIFTAAALAGLAFAFLYMPPLLLFVPGLYALTANGLCRRIFKDYLPKDLPLQEEDVQDEE